jgi:hypothetical protein
MWLHPGRIEAMRRAGMGGMGVDLPHALTPAEILAMQNAANHVFQASYNQDYLPGGTGGNYLTITEPPPFPSKSEQFMSKYGLLIFGGAGLVLMVSFMNARK